MSYVLIKMHDTRYLTLKKNRGREEKKIVKNKFFLHNPTIKSIQWKRKKKAKQVIYKYKYFETYGWHRLFERKRSCASFIHTFSSAWMIHFLTWQFHFLHLIIYLPHQSRPFYILNVFLFFAFLWLKLGLMVEKENSKFKS